MLQGNDYSYVMYVSEANFLQQLYFGAKINENDIAFLTKYYGDAVSSKVDDFNIDPAHEFAPSASLFFQTVLVCFLGCFAESTKLVRLPLRR